MIIIGAKSEKVLRDYCLQVYKLSIGAASGLSWPSDRLVIQVLDDSTDPTVKVLVFVLLGPFSANIALHYFSTTFSK